MNAPRSSQFDDIYFSPENGLAETRHVFLNGNNLPQRWQGRSRFHIAELGFGTGLNALAAAKAFIETSDQTAHLVFSSIEKYPLSRTEIAAALEPFAAEFSDILPRYLANLPLRIQGEHPIRIHDKVTIILHIGAIENALPCIEKQVDAWFLDGFAPAKNPDMWQDWVFAKMRDLSAHGASFATFTAAGAVKRGLADAGFAVRKVGGYGRKRDMLVGEIDTGLPHLQAPKAGHVAIIGGGLAGTAAAHALSSYGVSVTLYEQGETLAGGASGNMLGLFNPRFSKLWNDEAHFYSGAYAMAAKLYAGLPGIDYRHNGNLHLITSDMRAGKLIGTAQNWHWHEHHIALLDAKAAGDIAGIPLNHAALFLPDGGSVNPALVCQAFANGVDVQLQAVPETLPDTDSVILANGYRAADYLPDLPLQTVRGQIGRIKTSDQSAALRCNLQYGGYLSAAHDGTHILGATFQPWLTDLTLRDDDHARMLDELDQTVPGLGPFDYLGGRAALRTTTPFRKPLIGHIADNIYVSTAHGSHGLITAPWAAWQMVKALALGFVTKKAL
jgi:tRNA 5-methylaminomethyl-2-thiouridine biosynthesis bifunctional protein